MHCFCFSNCDFSMQTSGHRKRLFFYHVLWLDEISKKQVRFHPHLFVCLGIFLGGCQSQSKKNWVKKKKKSLKMDQSTTPVNLTHFLFQFWARYTDSNPNLGLFCANIWGCFSTKTTPRIVLKICD